MRVKVIFYGGLKNDVGAKEQELQFESETLTVAQLKAGLSDRYPGLRSKLKSVVCAVGSEIVDDDLIIGDGSEVALLPPVSGG